MKLANTKRRKCSKRKSSKRKCSKRKSSKRKCSKRKSSKRKSSKRKRKRKCKYEMDKIRRTTFGQNTEYPSSPLSLEPRRSRRPGGIKGASSKRRKRPLKFGYVDYLIDLFELIGLAQNEISLRIQEKIDYLKYDLEQQLYVGIKQKLEDMDEDITEENILEVSRNHKFQADINDMFDNPRMFNKLIQTIFERTQNLPDTLEDNNDLSLFLDFYRKLYSKLRLEEMGRESIIEESVARRLQKSYRKKRGDRELQSIYSSYGPLDPRIPGSIPRINNMEALRYEHTKNKIDFGSWWNFRNYIHKLPGLRDTLVINFLCTGHPLREPDLFEDEVCTPDEFTRIDLKPLVKECYRLIISHEEFKDYSIRKLVEAFRSIREQTRRFRENRLERVERLLKLK
jgi:hypothetical protein